MSKWNYYSIFCGYFGILQFLYGFFLSSSHTNTSSGSVNGVKNLNQELYGSLTNVQRVIVDKLVIVVIDALRYDFIDGKNVEKYMPYVSSTLFKNEACLLPCKVQLPTVTMPRIKTMTVGSVSNFVDIVLNLGSSKVNQDNILAQAVKMNKKVVFYGDDTWIKLFPGLFARYEGTTSFFVSDFVEVDYNVTRNVKREIEQEDWNIMVLHYLGLDHIGHLEGPFSSKISWKLNEMDDVVKLIHQKLGFWKEKKNENFLMIICGDHGMKDTGGHGGSTVGETLVPFLALGTSCQNKTEISQVDIAVTISILMGLPIPQENVGKIISEMIENTPRVFQLDAYHLNVMQLIRNYKSVVDNDASLGIKEIQAFFDAKKSNREADINNAVRKYETLLSQLSSKLIKSLTRFDIFCLYIAIITLLQAFCLPIISTRIKDFNINYIIVLTCITIFGLLKICSFCQNDSIICRLEPLTVTFNCVVSFILSFNSILLLQATNIMLKRLNNFFQMIKNDVLLVFILICSLLQIISTLSTSFIEEEHMMWYFFWTTFLTLVMITTHTNKTDITLLIFSLIIQRTLRKLNQTGDQWASLPDISDWLIESQNKTYLTIYVVLGLIGTFFIVDGLDMRRKRKINCISYCFLVLEKCLTISCLIMVYLYRAAVKDVACSEEVSKILSDKGIIEYRIFLFFFLVIFLVKFLRMLINYSFLLTGILQILIKLWVLLICLLLRPNNIILPFSLILTSNIMNRILRKQPHKIIKLVFIHHWLARVYFFYQGNSNSLASIDIASGYVGQSSYNSVVVGFFIICSTYSLPILAYLLMIKQYIGGISKNYKKQDWNNFSSMVQYSIDILLVLETFSLFFYTIVIMIFRHHLFIWSVFSPKLLYLSAYYLLLYPVVIVLQFFLNVYNTNSVIF